eukprot:TRINITY_DN3901_c0_g1_i1.p1 TRINITY_DN3901_c0_g1~~TRINITY_DN3901_c0_g1_i1.p1  ORF type:complete len:617 (-),score=140.40 TRINITY_DN3901_c0_g1_i1:119-1969(-)
MKKWVIKKNDETANIDTRDGGSEMRQTSKWVLKKGNETSNDIQVVSGPIRTNKKAKRARKKKKQNKVAVSVGSVVGEGFELPVPTPVLIANRGKKILLPKDIEEKEWRGFGSDKPKGKQKGGKQKGSYDHQEINEYDSRMRSIPGFFKKFMNKTPFLVKDHPFFVVGCSKLLAESPNNFAELLFVNEGGKRPIDNFVSIFEIDQISISCRNPYDISFQCIIIPLLKIITDNSLGNTQKFNILNELRSIDGLLESKLSDCLEEISLPENRSIILGDVKTVRYIRRTCGELDLPQSYVDIFLPVIKVYSVLSRLDKNFFGSKEITDSLLRILELCTINFEREFSTPTNKPELEEVVQKIKIKLSYILPESSTKLENVIEMPPVYEKDTPLETLDFPGELSKYGPRHDNDFVDFRKIKILPTFKEIVSPRESFIPLNDLNSLHFIEYPNEKYLDIMFRLLRENVIGVLKQSFISLFMSSLNSISGRLKFRISSKEKYISKKTIKTLENLAQFDFGSNLDPRECPLYIQRDNGSDLQVYNICAVLPPHIDKSKGFGFSFSVYSSNIEKFDQNERAKFWKTTKQLQFGSLVGLYFYDFNELYFGTVINREISKTPQHKCLL